MLAAYIEMAMGMAVVEQIAEGEYLASIPGVQGPWGHGRTKTEAKEELRSVFEEWLVVALREDDDLPVLGGVSLNFGGKRWQKQPAGKT